MSDRERASTVSLPAEESQLAQASDDADEALQSEYARLQPLAEGSMIAIRRELEELFRRNGVRLASPLQSRVKTWSSVLEKLGRVKLELKSLLSLQDLIGFRALVLFSDEQDEVERLVRETLTPKREYRTSDRYTHEQFGYVSTHFVFSAPDTWLSVPSLADFRGFQAELQVRTLAQHLWAEASNRLQYKQEDGVPIELRRSVHRISALLELVDLEYVRLWAMKGEYQKQAQLQDREAKLNVDLLESLLSSLLPPENRIEKEPYGEILLELAEFGGHTIGYVRDLVSDCLSEALKSDRRHVRRFKVRDWAAPEADRLRKRVARGVYFTHTGLVREMLRAAEGNEYDTHMKAKALVASVESAAVEQK